MIFLPFLKNFRDEIVLLYVLYPWQGKQVLSKGAIIPYFEFTIESRLTDDEWKKLLDSPQKPDVPEWIKPIISDGN